MRRTSLRGLLKAVLLAVILLAGRGQAVPAAAASGVVHGEVACLDMPMPMHTRPSVSATHHGGSTGCACCSMANCPAVLPPSAALHAAMLRDDVAYAPRSEFGHGITTTLVPDPPRPPAL